MRHNDDFYDHTEQACSCRRCGDRMTVRLSWPRDVCRSCMLDMEAEPETPVIEEPGEGADHV